MSGLLPLSPQQQAQKWLFELQEGGCTPELATRLLLMFPKDENFKQLETALAADDVEAAFRAAHTLKGLSGSLCLNELYEPVCRLSDLLKQRNTAKAEPLMAEIRPIYNETLVALETLK